MRAAEPGSDADRPAIAPPAPTPRRAPLVLALLVALSPAAARADVLDFLGLRKRDLPGIELAEDKLLSGLREALARGVENAVTNLGRMNGFLSDPDVRIPMPDQLSWAERALRVAGREDVTEQFVAAMNRAAETAVPHAGAVLGDAVRQLTIEDARSLLQSKNDSALTEYFERVSRTNLHARLLPLVRQATESTSVTAAYQRLVGQIPEDRLGFFGRLRAAIPKVKDFEIDLDEYITGKTLDGLFVKIAEEEERIRKDPAARTTEILRDVFSRARH